jgi:type I restriction enzyme S subunit
LLMSRANTTELVGAVAYVDQVADNLVLPDKIWRFEWHDAASVPTFYHAVFRSPAIRRRISRMSSGTGGSMKNVSKEKLANLRLPAVSFADQQRFAAHVEGIEAQRANSARALAAEDELFASIQARAFRGEL